MPALFDGCSLSVAARPDENGHVVMLLNTHGSTVSQRITLPADEASGLAAELTRVSDMAKAGVPIRFDILYDFAKAQGLDPGMLNAVVNQAVGLPAGKLFGDGTPRP